jgi:2-amino-4-hydroxy-6-hydroxymethyldihydropteridine diphosphokinase
VTRAYLGIGSNIDAEANLRLAVRELRRRFGDLELSSIYRSRPVGFEGSDFLNAVVGLDTCLSPQQIVGVLEEIHALAGRGRGERKLVSRTLDIDLLLYDRLVLEKPRLPRDDVLIYNFVLRPLAELVPDFVHPLTGRRLADHWRSFDAESGAVRYPLTGVQVEGLQGEP